MSRIICECYAKLICAVQFLYFCFPVRWKENAELSFEKGYRLFKKRSREFFIALKSRYRLMRFAENLISDMGEFAMKDRDHRKRKSTYQKLISELSAGSTS